MYKNLCTDGLGVSIRQNELIELALTYGYNGIEIDMEDMVGRAEKMGHQFATQFVNSADVEISTFHLPVDFNASDEDYAALAGKIDQVCELAKSISATHCYITVASKHPSLTYPENFEKHRERIADLANRLAENGTKIGLQFSAGVPNGEDMQFIHKPEEILALVKSIGHSNVGFVLDTWNWQVAGGTIDQIKELDLSTVTEVRMADPPEGFDPADADRSQRLEPGTHPASICQSTQDWLVESGYEGPVALTAQISKTSGNHGDILFQRIAKVFDQMLAGAHGQDPAAAEAGDADAASTDGADAASTDGDSETTSTPDAEAVATKS